MSARLLIAALLAELLFLPLFGMRARTLRLDGGQAAAIECDGDTLYVATQTRTRITVECLADGAQPIVPTATPSKEGIKDGS